MSERTIRVLAIDDDKVNNYVTERLLNQAFKGCELGLVPNGQKALDALQAAIDSQTYPDLILLDLKMPEMGGFEFLTVYESEYYPFFSQTALYVVTSSIRDADRVRADEFNCVDGFVVKPVKLAWLQSLDL